MIRRILRPPVRAARRVRDVLGRFWVRTASRYSWSASILYGLFRPAFRREHLGVSRGIAAYLRRTKGLRGGDRYLLRRNVHRIEKGLVMRPRRSVFALGYIGETVSCFVRISQADRAVLEPGELKWAQDVLTLYFETVPDDEPKIRKCRQRFEACVRSLAQGVPMVPYARAHSTTSTIGYEDFYNLCRQRRSVRWYQPKPVPRELLDKAILAAAQSPSACNRQPFHFRIFDDPDLVPKVAELPGGTVGFRENIPVMIAVVGNLSAFFDERDRHLIYIDGSLASMTLMLALETLGLSACPLNWPDVPKAEAKMAKLLSLAPHERVVMCISVGYADPEGMIPFSGKKDLDSMRGFN